MRVVRLPVKARDPRRLAKILEPEPAGAGLLGLEACQGLDCRVCVFHEPPRVEVEWRTVQDPLSSLRMRLPVVRAVYCGRTVWEARWRRGYLVVDSVECPAALVGEEELVVLGELVKVASLGDVARVLAEKCGVSDAGRGHRPRRPG